MLERQEFSFEYLRSRERQIAYILSAAAACIAFAMTLADREFSRIASVCFLIAIACWSCSFLFGVMARNQSIKLLAKSVIVGDMLPEIEGSPSEKAIAFEAADKYITEFDFRINRYRFGQLALLMLGAITFMTSIITSAPSFSWIFESPVF